MAKDKKQLTELAALGEFGLIDALTKGFSPQHKGTVKAVGDDAAVLDAGDKYMVVTTDMLVEGIHFDLIYTPLKHLGYKSVVVNLSDVCAMNATPKQITVSIAVSNKVSLEALEELYEGVKLACDIYGIDLIGGDTSSSEKGLFISVTAIGEVEKEKVAYRNMAKDKQLICVSGNLGAAYAGVQLLEREKAVFNKNPNFQPAFEGYSYLLERQLKPEARKDIVELLKELDITPASMIDISDGLSSEILHICSQSGTGCKIYEDKIPVHEQVEALSKEMKIDPSIFAMNGGEDYELLFTVPVEHFEALKDQEDIAIVGHICDATEGCNLVARDGTEVAIQAQGWNAMES